MECVTEQQLLLIAGSWGGVTLGMAFTLMQGSGSGAHVYQAQVCCGAQHANALAPHVAIHAQVSTSSSRVVKILGDALCVRALMRDTCGCDVTLSLAPPAAAVAEGWGCADTASIAGA